MTAETSLLRWGGLAGMLGGIMFILVTVIVLGFVPPDPVDPEGFLIRFPDVVAARTVENSLYLVVLILLITLFAALYRALRETSLAPALFGSVLGVVGLVVLAAGSMPHVALAPISDLYHAPGATPEEQATLVLLWQATHGIFDELLAVGLLLMMIGFIVLGVGMLGAPAFGKGFGGVSVVLGAVGVIGVSFFVGGGVDLIGLAAILGFLILPLVLGWKVYRLSRVA